MWIRAESCWWNHSEVLGYISSFRYLPEAVTRYFWIGTILLEVTWLFVSKRGGNVVSAIWLKLNRFVLVSKSHFLILKTCHTSCFRRRACGAVRVEAWGKSELNIQVSQSPSTATSPTCQDLFYFVVGSLCHRPMVYRQLYVTHDKVSTVSDYWALPLICDWQFDETATQTSGMFCSTRNQMWGI